MELVGLCRPRAAAFAEALRAEVLEFETTDAAAAVIDVGGDLVADIAVGRAVFGLPLEPERLWAIYCCGKLAIAAAVVLLAEEGRLGLDDRLADVLPAARSRWLGDLKIRWLLDNSAGLHGPSMIVARVLPEPMRDDWVLDTARPEGWESGRKVAYAIYAPWHLIGLVIEQVTGQPYHEFVQGRVVDAWQVPRDEYVVRFTPSSFDQLGTRIAPARADDNGGRLALLAEAGRETALEWNPAFGSYATTRGLARLVRGLLEDMRGAGRVLSESAARVIATTSVAGFDGALGREVAYGLGPLTELGSHGLAECPPRSFGLSAEGAIGIWVTDAELDAVVVLRFDRMTTDPVSADQRRARVLAAAWQTMASA